MRVKKPDRVVPRHREIGLLLDQKTILLEDGTEWPYPCAPDGTKLYATKEVIHNLFMEEKLGEVMKYDNVIRKWRLTCPSRYKSRTSWSNDEQEVNVLNHRFMPDTPEKLIESLCEWRDWVESYGGEIVGTISSSAYSLFKTTIPGYVWETPYNPVPGIEVVIGGRLLPCKSLWSTFEGDFIHWDLYSAYTRKLSKLRFGGSGSYWKEVSPNHNYDSWVEKGWLIYIEAEVHIPKFGIGPLPKRRKYHVSKRPEFDPTFPRGEKLVGIWTYEEIRIAEASGSRVKRLRAYAHFATGKFYHFQDWYRIIEEGRDNLTGFAKGLAKMTGNSLWGRFAMRSKPARTVYRENGDPKRLSIPHHTWSSGRNQCIELADQLSGKIRAELLELALSAGENLIQGNTDGAWIENKKGWLPPTDDWRIKRRAERIQIIDDTTYKFWEDKNSEPTYVCPGVNLEYAEQTFERIWSRHFEQSAA